MGYILGEPTVQQYFDANGDPLENGTIEFFIYNTSTPTPIYSNSTGTSAGTSVTLNSIGAPENGGTSIALFFDESVVYKIVRKDSAGSAIAPTIGPYYPNGGSTLAIDAVASTATDSLYDYTGTSNGDQASVAGYYVPGDGGGGMFYWNSTSTDADDAGVTILPTGHVGAGRWKRIISDNINVRWFGAKGDGVTDDYSSIQASCTAAASLKASVAFYKGTYLHNSRIKAENGVRGILGFGGVLLAGNTGCGILLRGIYDGAAENVSNCDVKGLRIDGGGVAVTAIEGQNVQFSVCSGNTITNVIDGYGIMYRTYLAGARQTAHIVIDGNVIDLNNNAYGAQRNGISIDVLNTELNYAPYANEAAYWAALWVAPTSTYYAEHCAISNNVVNGGYYGIDLVMAKMVSITGNTVRNNTRNISMQWSSQWNVVSGNVLIDPRSTAVHVSGDSKNNVVSANTIRTSALAGQGTLQCQWGSTNNTFVANTINHTAGGGNNYFVYIGPKCGYNKVSNNTFNGDAYKAGVGVESAWNPATTNTASFAYSQPTAVNATDIDLIGVSVCGNMFNLTRAVPAIFLSAVTDPQGNHDLKNCDISHNIIPVSTPLYDLEIYELGGSEVSGLTLIGNSFNDATTTGQFIQPRGYAHYASRSGNAQLDTEAVNIPDGETAPDISFGALFDHGLNTTGTSVTNYGGGVDGVAITLKLNAFTTIVNNSSLIRLKGGVNLVSGSANDFVVLQKRGTIWYEKSRNF